MSRIFLAPRWIQAVVVCAIFIALLLLMQKLGWRHSVTYVVVSVLLGLVFTFNIRLGLGGRVSLYVGEGKSDVTTTRSKNDIARLAALNADPFLAPFARPMLLPVQSALLTVVLFSGLWWVWICLLLVLVQVLMKKLGQRVSLMEVAAGQVRRDRHASTLMDHLRSGKPVRGEYYIYLRPFAITGQLHAENPGTVEKAVRRWHEIEKYSSEGKQVGVEWPLINPDVSLGWEWSASELNPEWEAIFEKGFRRLGNLVALGRAGESVGAGRILTSEDDWRETLVQLSHQASGFLIVPSSNPGTLWEIQWLREALTFKNCYFFLPGWQSGEGDGARWEALRKQLWPILRLPAAMGTPAMFAVDGGGRPHVAILPGPTVLAGGKEMRVFLTASGIEYGVEALASIATRSSESETDRFVEIADRLLGAIGRGREGLLELHDLPDELRRLLNEREDSVLSRLSSYKTFVPAPGLEELYYHDRMGCAVLTLRQEGIVGDKPFVFYVNIGTADKTLRLLGFSFVSQEDDLRLRSYIPGGAGSHSGSNSSCAADVKSD